MTLNGLPNGRHVKACCYAALFAVAAIAPLRAELEPLLCQRGEVLFSDNFEDVKSVTERWFFREHWTVAGGNMVRTGMAGDNQRVFIKKPSYGDCIIELEFAFHGAKEIRVMTGTPGKYNAVVILWPNGFRVTTASDQTVPYFPAIHGECRFDFQPATMYPLMIEIRGEEIVVRVDDDHAIAGRHPILARQRDYFAFQADQPSAAFDEVRLTKSAGAAKDWVLKKEAIDHAELERPWLPHGEEEQRKIRETIARDLLYRTDAGFRTAVALVEGLKAAQKSRFPEVFATVKERRKKLEAERKRLLREDAAYKALRDGINKLGRAEVEMLHLLHPKLKTLPEAQYHLALARARVASAEVTAYQVVVANRQLAEAKRKRLYPQLARTDQELLAESRAAREKVAKTPAFQSITKRVAEAVRAEKGAVAEAAAKLPIRFE